MSKAKIDWKASYHVMRNALDKELENNKAHTAEIARLKKIVSDQESAFRGQENCIRQHVDSREKDARLIADKVNVINANARRMMDLETDLRIAEQNLCLERAKYQTLMEVVALITGKTAEIF